MSPRGGTAAEATVEALPLVLPPEGINLRATLAHVQRVLVDQALDRAAGNLPAAARLLAVTPLDLARLSAGADALAPEPAAATRAERRRALEVVRVPDELPRIERGIEMISAAVIKRLTAEGRSPREIGKRIGCNPYTVEKVLRMETEREARQLAKGGMRPRHIAQRLGVTIGFVERALHGDLAKCGSEPPPPPEPDAAPATTPPPPPSPPAPPASVASRAPARGRTPTERSRWGGVR